MSADATYCAITFAPIQGFIEKSRKLRDLYGSSFILSYLASSICNTAQVEDWELISPALPSITKGTPNQIILKDRGNRPKTEEPLRTTFDGAWQSLVNEIRHNLETTTLTTQETYTGWQRSWELWSLHAWEWFCVIGEPGQSITDVRKQLNEAKRSRNWIGVNWQGESSTLSGIDAIAWPKMDVYNPKTTSRSDRQTQIKAFYEKLTRRWDGKMIDSDERLSIPDLVKRLITLPEIARRIDKLREYPDIETPDRFKDLNRIESEQYSAWFMGDGDKIGDYLKSLSEAGVEEAIALNDLSYALTQWGNQLDKRVKAILAAPEPPRPDSRIIYAGGDDFLGVLYRTEEPKLTPSHWLPWLYQVSRLWDEYKTYAARTSSSLANPSSLTVSMGLVWAAPGVPQRDVLQHCREAEKSAKNQGRNRVALRILFNSGTHLEWACPWALLEPILTADCNWTHFYRDVNTLLARHALMVPPTIAAADIQRHTQVAKVMLCHHLKLPQKPDTLRAGDRRLWESVMNRDRWCTQPKAKADEDFGILPPEAEFLGRDRVTIHSQIAQAFNDWVVNLASVGFHLLRGADKTQQTDTDLEVAA